MKLRTLLSMMLLIVGLGVVPVADAAPAVTSLNPIADDISYIAGNVTAETPLVARGSNVGGCLSQYETFLKFDLGSVPAGHQITGAILTMRSTGFLTGSTSLTMKLWGSIDTGWSEGANQIPWASKPALSADLGSTATGPVIAGSNIIFNNTAQFVAYLNQQLAAAGKLATLAITLTECNTPAAGQYMASKETTGANGVPAKLDLTTVEVASSISGNIEVMCKNGFKQAATGSVDVRISSSDGSYDPPTFTGAALGANGAFSVLIPTDKCTAPGVCSLTLADVANLTNSAPGVLCPANGDTFVYPPGAGWTYMNQPAKPFQNVVTLAAGASPMSANVGTLNVVPGVTPNAVTMSTFRAAYAAPIWPLIIAGLLLVAALAGFGIYRRRLSQVRAR
jgi:hypothetical protein